MKTTKIKQIIKITFFIFFFSANFSFAQDATENFKQTADNLTNNVLTSVGTLLMTAAFLFFFYGVVVFILGRVSGKGDMAKLEQGKQFMLWGLIALFVMVSVWGIVRLAQDMLGVKGSDIQIKPVQFVPMVSGGSKVENNPVGSTASNNKFTKAEGASCITLAGSDSECAAGMFCRGYNGASLSVGQPGTCQKPASANAEILAKYQSLVDLAEAKIINNSSKKIEVKNSVLSISGQVQTREDYNALWDMHDKVNPGRSGEVSMGLTIK